MNGVPSVRALMTCEELESNLHPYVDGEFEGPERGDIEAHLALCPRCRDAIAAERAFREKVRQSARDFSALNPAAPQRLRVNIAAGLALQARRNRWHHVRPYIAWSFAAAATAATVALVVRVQVARERATDMLNAAVAGHQRALPLEVNDPRLPAVSSWLNGKIDFATTAIPLLRNASLVGARLSHLSDREAAYLRYSAKSERPVSLFVFDASDLSLPGGRKIDDRDVLLANQRGYNVAVWKDREIAYYLVSDLEEQDILDMLAPTDPKAERP
jgi:anti-sigma factor RsiW